jgi:hypothetical protein
MPARDVAAELEPAVPARPGPAPRRADEPAPPAVADDGADRLQRRLADLRRSLEEHPRDSGEERRESAAPAPPGDRARGLEVAVGGAPPVLEERTEVSIGTIVVSVEEPPATPTAAPAPGRPERRAAVPRHWVSGW